MKTRVGKYYDVTSGVWMFYVQKWADARPDWLTANMMLKYTSGPAAAPPLLPAGWVNWPFENDTAFHTPDEARATRVARELSEGKAVEPRAIIVEFADGVQFTPVE